MRISLTIFFNFLLLIATTGWSQTPVWEKTSGPANEFIRDLVINNNGYIFAGAYWSKIYRSYDNGDSWNLIVDLDGSNALIWTLAVNDSGHIFAATNGGEGVYRSRDNGDNWEPANTGLTNHSVNDVACSDSGFLFAATDYGVFRSSNNGNTWIMINNGLQASDSIIYSIGVHPNGHIFIGTYGNGIFRSTDNGDSWQQKNNGLQYFDIRSITFNSVGHIFIGPDDGQGIHRSDDEGETWQYFNTGLPTSAVIYNLDVNINDEIFIGHETDGVFKSADNGETWVNYSNGLNDNGVRALSFNHQGFLFAGTQGDGVYRTINSTTNLKDTATQIKEFYLEHNFPNPFNPSTTIAFSLPKAYKIKITIYSVTGEKVSELIDGYASMGYHTVKWNGRDQNGHPASTGIYLYELIAGSHRKVGKMFLVR